MLTAAVRRRALISVAALTSMVGALAALRYAALGLTLSHYDSRGHLVVARRILDSITPGWQQIGAVWLPLPHLLDALPVQVDLFYRTGAAAIVLSIVSFAVASAAITSIVLSLTRSRLAAAAGLAVFALNPNVLYLQATPMTEPLLLALTTTSIALLLLWCECVVGSKDPTLRTDATGRTNDMRRVGSSAFAVASADRRSLGGGWSDPTATMSDAAVGWTFALACLTRYDAWPVTIGSLAATVWVLWRRGLDWRDAARRVSRIAAYPLAAIAGFMIFSRVVVGAWFSSGFFVPENPAQGRPYHAVAEIVWGLRELSGYGLVMVATAGAVVLAAAALVSRGRAQGILPLALTGTAAVPWSAYMDGHPYRIRYAVPLIAAEAICAGVLVGRFKRGRVVVGVALLGLAAYELRPVNLAAPMIVEAQWDQPNRPVRDAVTACLQREYRGETIMASMGSLGHYMQDLSQAGFSIRDILHEGNGDIWLNALDTPRPYVGWILIEEKAEGGDMLATIARSRPAFLDGFTRVCEGAGLVLYRRAASPETHN